MKKITILFVVILIVGIGIYLAIKNYEAPGGGQETGQESIQEIDIDLVAQGFTSPVAFVSSYDNTGRMFLVDQIGFIKIVDSEGKVLENNFLDLRNKLVVLTPNYDERGLLGLAFHPNFKENGRFFVYYSAPLRAGAPSGWNHTSVLSEFKVDENNPDKADSNSEKIILQIDQPQSNHNGGHIAFGPDGYLYIPLGDGGQANDVGSGHSAAGNGQDVSTLLGKILRIDIDKVNPYSVPEDNPFLGEDGLDEIFAFGFRNPYHISFDAGGNNELFVADVGQNLWEEVNIVTKGGNYGWNVREGEHCFDPENADQSPADCPATGIKGEPLLAPVVEYGHSGNGGIGVANVGGYVYRGKAIEGLEGNYVFADWSRGFTEGDGSVFAADLENGKWSFRELNISNGQNGRLGLFIKGVGQDADNELYLLTTETLGPSAETGKIFKIVLPRSESTGQKEGIETKEEKVSIKNFSFNPQTITVSKETKVIWTNEDSAPHTVTSQGNFDSGNLSQGGTFSFTFIEAGTFDYICAIHPGMEGKITVE